jgi:serine/threonine-protein kinase HipA
MYIRGSVEPPLLMIAEIVPLIAALEAATPNLRSSGLKQFDDLIGRETEQLVELLSAAVAIRERDYFPHGSTGVGRRS